jgi:crotonobetaine/carnitine-CoA ligase
VLTSEAGSRPVRDLQSLSVGDSLRAAAREAPDAIFLIHSDEQISYGEFDRQVDAAAAVWQSLGIARGDRVAFMLGNQPAFLVAWLGLARAGGVLVAINTRWQQEEIAYFLGLTEPRAAVVGSELEDVFRRGAASYAGMQQLVVVPHGFGFVEAARGADGGLGASVASLTTPSDTRQTVRSADPVSFISTSGTTGRPKAVIQTNGNFVLTGEGYATWVDLQPGERIYLCLPLFHINSQAYTVMGAIAARATIVMVERFSASRFWADMNRYGVNVFNFVGSMLAILLQREPTPEERSHQVRLAYGGPIPPQPPRAEIERRFHLTLISGIGMSENTFGLIESMEGERREGSLGKARQHPDPRIVNEARVVDDEDQPVPPGHVGELVYKNPVMMAGYYRNPEGTAEAMRNGWLHTGDLVRQDADGYFYFVDRKKDIVRVRGENVAPAEVEAVLVQHSDVAEAGVIGVPSALTEEDVAAFVVPRADRPLDAGTIVDWCAARLAPFKVPKYVWIVDSLPKTETQRIEKHRLRETARTLLSAPGSPTS